MLAASGAIDERTFPALSQREKPITPAVRSKLRKVLGISEED